jgi:hypothetical protein
MAALGNLFAALPAAGEDARGEATQQFNAAALRAPVTDANDLSLASPVTGAGVAVNLIDRLFLDARHNRDAALERVRNAAASGQLKLSKQGKVLETPQEKEDYVRERAAFFFADFLPFLRLLRVVD